MANARALRHEPAHGVLRSRGAARRRGDDHAGPVPVTRRVTVFHAPDCALCERALEVVHELQAAGEVEFELELVDIAGNADLERRYREHLPVVEVDGSRAFSYFVEPDALAARLRR